MEYFFVISNNYTYYLNWNKIDSLERKNTRYILFPSPLAAEKIYQQDRKKLFWKVIPVDFEGYGVDTLDNIEVLTKKFESIIVNVKNQYMADGDTIHIITFLDVLLPIVSKLHTLFQLNGMQQINDMECFFNKDVAKRMLLEKGMEDRYFPKYQIFSKEDYCADSSEYVKKLDEKIGFPVFVKPISGSCSLESSKIENVEEFHKWCENSDKNTVYEIDEFIQGEMYQCSSVVIGDEIKLSIPTQYLTPLANIVNRSSNGGMITLSKDTELYDEIIKFNADVINKLTSVNDTVTYLEFFIKEDGQIVFLEIANRVIGASNNAADFLAILYGIDLRVVDFKLKLQLHVDLKPINHLQSFEANVVSFQKKKHFIISENFPSTSSYIRKVLTKNFPYYPLDMVFGINISNQNRDALYKDSMALQKANLLNQVPVDCYILKEDSFQPVLNAFDIHDSCVFCDHLSIKSYSKSLDGNLVLVVKSFKEIIATVIMEKIDVKKKIRLIKDEEFIDTLDLTKSLCSMLNVQVEEMKELINVAAVLVKPKFKTIKFYKQLVAVAMSHLAEQKYKYVFSLLGQDINIIINSLTTKCKSVKGIYFNSINLSNRPNIDLYFLDSLIPEVLPWLKNNKSFEKSKV